MDSPSSARSNSSAKSSPEAELGHRVEDLWDIQEPQLSPSEKLNSCFESILVSAFPPASSPTVEIPSDCTLANAVKILSDNNLMSAPVCDVEAPENSTWIDRYLGIVEFAGIAVWLLHQSEKMSATKKQDGSAAADGDANELAAKVATMVKLERTSSQLDRAAIPEVVDDDDDATNNGNAKPVKESTPPTESTMKRRRSFLDFLAPSEFYQSTKVSDISGSFRWAPFLALRKSDSFLTMLLLLSKYKMKSLPVVDLGEGNIDNIITQSDIIHMLAECVGLHWFEDWGTKKLHELGLPIMKPKQLIKVKEDEPVLNAFQLMRRKGVGGVPVMDESGNKPVGTISINDIQFLFTLPSVCDNFRSITVKEFVVKIRNAQQEGPEEVLMSNIVTCEKVSMVKDVILMLDMEKIQRVYVVDRDGNLEGVVTLRDIISKLVHEPHGYFGDFFDGVVPLPQNSRV